MLSFYYSFLILVLGSSVMAMPSPRSRQQNGETKVLRGNKDVRLQNKLWCLFRLSEKQLSEKEETDEEWTGDAEYLDYALRFVGTKDLGVQEVELSRVKRELLSNDRRGPAPKNRDQIHNEYRVVRPNERRRPGETLVILEPVPIDQSRHLHDTY
jgi:hypothetical protein